MVDSHACVVGAVVVAVLVVAIFIALGYDSLEPTQYGLSYNKISKNFDRDYVYEGGRHWVGIFNSFIEFPALQQSIEFSDSQESDSGPLKTRTQEGLALTLYVSFQYKLIKEEIPQLYDMSNLNYEQTFVRIARDIILQEAGSYQAPQYWRQRNTIGLRMEALLDDSLKQAHARCMGLQILKIQLPPTFEQSIVDTQVEVQKTQMKTLEQQAEIVRQNIRVMSSKADQQILVIDSSAKSAAIFIQESARALIWEETLDLESYIFNQVKTALSFSNDELEQYQYYQALMEQNNKTMLVEIKNPIIQIVG